jgi:hypothetical protein
VLLDLQIVLYQLGVLVQGGALVEPDVLVLVELVNQLFEFEVGLECLDVGAELVIAHVLLQLRRHVEVVEHLPLD